MNKKTLDKKSNSTGIIKRAVALLISLTLIILIITVVINIAKLTYKKGLQEYHEKAQLKSNNPVIENDDSLQLYDEKTGEYIEYKMKKCDTSYDIYLDDYNTNVNTKYLPIINKDDCTEETKLTVWLDDKGSKTVNIESNILFPNILTNKDVYDFNVNLDKYDIDTKKAIVFEIVTEVMLKNAVFENEYDETIYNDDQLYSEDDLYSKANKSDVYLGEGRDLVLGLVNNNDTIEEIQLIYKVDTSKLSNEEKNYYCWTYTKRERARLKMISELYSKAFSIMTDKQFSEYESKENELEKSGYLISIITDETYRIYNEIHK